LQIRWKSAGFPITNRQRVYERLKKDGVPVPDLPVVAAAPDYMEQKATIDAVFALALDLFTYVNPVPTVTGAPRLVKLLTQDCQQVTGGLLNVECDPVKAADAMLAHIESNRRKVGL
jgi:carbon-monoxide dehydrogenase catalytic subunit